MIDSRSMPWTLSGEIVQINLGFFHTKVLYKHLMVDEQELTDLDSFVFAP